MYLKGYLKTEIMNLHIEFGIYYLVCAIKEWMAVLELHKWLNNYNIVSLEMTLCRSRYSVGVCLVIFSIDCKAFMRFNSKRGLTTILKMWNSAHHVINYYFEIIGEYCREFENLDKYEIIMKICWNNVSFSNHNFANSRQVYFMLQRKLYFCRLFIFFLQWLLSWFKYYIYILYLLHTENLQN